MTFLRNLLCEKVEDHQVRYRWLDSWGTSINFYGFLKYFLTLTCTLKKVK